MPAPVLATVAQLEARLGHAVDAIRATALLEDASAVIRGYTGQHFSRVVGDVVTLPVTRGLLVLPQRPADKPTAIANIDGVAIPASAWYWGGVGVVEFGSPSWVANGPSRTGSPRTVMVTYSHGYPEIPGDVIAVACQMVGRVLDGSDTPGIMSEAIDDYQFRLGGGLVSGAVAMVPDERRAMDRYRRRVGSAVLR